jgi:phage tail sheath protein FI
MASALTYPGVYIEEIPSGVRTITEVATSIMAFIGRAQRGPTNRAVTINSFSDFERRLCRKNPPTIQSIVTITGSSLLQNVAKIFFATEPLCFRFRHQKHRTTLRGTQLLLAVPTMFQRSKTGNYRSSAYFPKT